MEKKLTSAVEATYTNSVQLYVTYMLKDKIFYQYNIIIHIKQHFHS